MENRIEREIGRTKQEIGFTGLELLAHSYLNALKMVSEHTGREVRSLTLRDTGGARIQVAREGIDNVHRYYELVRENIPIEKYGSLRELADRMYAGLSEVIVENGGR